MHGLLCEARKLTHVAYLRRDPVLPELIGIRRVASKAVGPCCRNSFGTDETGIKKNKIVNGAFLFVTARPAEADS